MKAFLCSRIYISITYTSARPPSYTLSIVSQGKLATLYFRTGGSGLARDYAVWYRVNPTMYREAPARRTLCLILRSGYSSSTGCLQLQSIRPVDHVRPLIGFASGSRSQSPKSRVKCSLASRFTHASISNKTQ